MLSDLALSLLRDGVTRGDMFFTVPQTPGTKAALQLYRSSLVQFDGMHIAGGELLRIGGRLGG